MNLARKGRESGQTIIVALIILGLLLILGFVFIGIINRSIQSGTRSLARNRSNDVAEAGVRYAHRQLLLSEEGADWHGAPTLPVAEAGQPNLTRDPDAFYIRPGNPTLAYPGTNQPDLGGPDGLGPYTRVSFDNDRALVRVRYAPSDFNLFSSDPRGSLRNPGAVRNYLLIESIGRNGLVNPSDPTTLGTTTALQFQNFQATGGQNALNAAVAKFQAAQSTGRTSRVARAFVAIGITDQARFITNKFKVSRAAELGIPGDIAQSYSGSAPTLQIGVPNVDPSNLGTAAGVPGLGSLRSNADLTLYGNVHIYTNRLFGDQFDVAGSLKGDAGAQLIATTQAYSFNGSGQIQWPTPIDIGLAGTQLDSRSPDFSTGEGVIRDGMVAVDQEGYSRGLGYEAPPSILTADPDTKETRYIGMTRESGQQVGDGNSGRYGHGGGVYVDNVSDRQTARTEAGREAPGSRSLVQDWLDPNNRDSTGWNGPFYMPRGAYLTLQNDGFTIVRDGRGTAEERVWRTYDGIATGDISLRYRLGRGSDAARTLRIVDKDTPGIADINGNLGPSDFDKGFAFNGVLYFEGNVRVRGVIPTDVQMSVVSGATIYIEGSILKGVTGSAVTFNDPERPAVNVGARLNRPSRSMLGLMAKDWVAVNTTMFFGPSPSLQPETVNDEPGLGLTPVRMRSDSEIRLQSEFVLAPQTGSYADSIDPTKWSPLPLTYLQPGTTNTKIGTELLLTHAAADQAVTQSFIAMNINRGVTDVPTVRSPYYFQNTEANSAYELAGVTQPFPVYGLGALPWQIYPKFETAGFPLVDFSAGNTAAESADRQFTDVSSTVGNYRLFNAATNEITIRPEFLNNQGWSDYLLGKAAIVPHDIKIEAMIYAEEGSFFVIPGQWFNPNVNDLRSTFNSRAAELVTQGRSAAEAQAIAEDDRLRDFGNGPTTPFYGEPIDVKISVSGAISENMPPPMAQQSEFLRKWGWIPGLRGSGASIPAQHLAANTDRTQANWIVPNLVIAYDPVLGTGRTLGFNELNLNNADNPTALVRHDALGRALPPIPRLPVSPALSYFGDLN